MDCGTVVSARFLSRPNRFIAIVEINGQQETVHVKNTGRCRELLIPGTKVWLKEGKGAKRKTRYDLIAVHKENTGIINMDSQLPNQVMKEWLEQQDYDEIKAEQTWNSSRFDFKLKRKNKITWLEVKGVTLEQDGQAMFPDAPTERGTRHILELIEAKKAGYDAVLAFVIQINGLKNVVPSNTDPKFKEALQKAREAGVEIWYMECRVTEREVTIIKQHKAPQG